jgi:hypothetical protein
METVTVIRPLFRVAKAAFGPQALKAEHLAATSGSPGPSCTGNEGGTVAESQQNHGGVVVGATQPADEFHSGGGCGGGDDNGGGYALLLLNAPSEIHEPFFKPLWSGASVTVCADGGSSRLFQRFGTE